MDSHSPALSEQIAGLRRAVQAAPAAAWLPATLHALIIACFARLFTRLEQMLQLWQSGDLVIPETPTRATTTRATTTRATTTRATTKSPHRRRAPSAPRRHSRHIRARQAATQAAPRHPRAIRNTAAIPPSAARQRPRPARDPPPPAARPLQTASPTHAHVIT